MPSYIYVLLIIDDAAHAAALSGTLRPFQAPTATAAPGTGTRATVPS